MHPPPDVVNKHVRGCKILDTGAPALHPPAGHNGFGMRFIHTADWQIGKVFRRFGEREALFRQARLDAIDALGALATREEAAHVLVAGDVYDMETPLPATRRAPLERMRRFPHVTWHLLPGNHDPHRPNGLWDQIAADDPPANVHLHLTPEPVAIADNVWILPAPLTRKSAVDDLTIWMDEAPTPPGAIRIGLAHGSVQGFDSAGEASNLIDPARPERAGLAYLALGDWHRTLKIGPRVHYAGTPEPDRFDSQEQGKALVVTLRGGAEPEVREEIAGRYRWQRLRPDLQSDEAVADEAARWRAIGDLPQAVLRLDLTGTLSLAARQSLEDVLGRLEAACAHLEYDLSGLHLRPTPEDIEAIDFDGALRHVAEELGRRIDDAGADPQGRAVAEAALTRLYNLVTTGERA
jgi:DNA repair exonuclease SbcCD nuclease subunit